ncbi:MAG: sulfatase, partial [Acidobacteria bacterium]|nr:sulfatase [Acidobacteriota bacterium]
MTESIGARITNGAVAATAAVARTWRAAAREGASAWLAFATFEYGFSIVLLRFVQPHCSSRPVRADFGLPVFALYPLVGALATCAVASVLYAAAGRDRMTRPAAARAIKDIALLTLVVAVAAGALRRFGSMAAFAYLGVAVALASSAAASVRWRAWADRAGVVANPWTVSLLLIGIPWLRKQVFIDRTDSLGPTAVTIYVAAVLAGSWWIARRRRAGRWRSARPLVPDLTAATVAILLAFWLDRALFGMPQTAAASSNGPNVILVVMDTVRADHLSPYGYQRNTTPFLDSLASGATLYRRAQSPADFTLASHASMFTGVFPTSHGARSSEVGGRVSPSAALPDKFRTLAEVLRSRGYRTAAIVANFTFLTPGFNIDQGFDSYALQAPRCTPASPFWLVQGLSRTVLPSHAPPRGRAVENAAEINQEAFAVLDRFSRDSRPFLLFVNYMDAHWPYEPPAPFGDRFPGSDDHFEQRRYYRLRNAVLQQQRQITDRERAHLLSQYDGAIAFIDRQIEALVARVKRLGLYDNSLIVVTSDHGEAFGERQLMEHWVSVYRDQVHVPLIIKYTNQRGADVVERPVSTADLYPTILQLAGVKLPAAVQATSLFDRGAPDAGPIISESFPRPEYVALHPRFRRIDRAIFEGPFKYIVSTDGRRELYNLDEDPDERRNLLTRDAATAKTLQRR